MRVAAFMSGSGTNIRRVLELERQLIEEEGQSPFNVTLIFSDDPTSKAQKIAHEYGITCVVNDLQALCAAREKPITDMDVRREYDEQTAELLADRQIGVYVCGGYMRRITAPLLQQFLGINVHPADLAIRGAEGPRYTGDRAVARAIRAGENHLRSSTHVVEDRPDHGRLLMRSRQLPVTLPEGFDPNDKDLVRRVADEHQSRLKEVGDWAIFPATIMYVAQGYFSQDSGGKLYFQEKPIPSGFILED